MEKCCAQFEDFIQYLEIIDEDLEGMDGEDLLQALYEFPSQLNCQDDQEKLVEDESN